MFLAFFVGIVIYLDPAASGRKNVLSFCGCLCGSHVLPIFYAERTGKTALKMIYTQGRGLLYIKQCLFVVPFLIGRAGGVDERENTFDK